MNRLPRFVCLVVLGLAALCGSVSRGETPRAIFNVRDYGVTGDGTTLETAGFRRAIEACVARGGGTVYLPPGRYLTGTIELKSHVTLELDAGATILGSENPDDYPTTKSVWGDPKDMMAPLIFAADAENIAITGRGTIDGQGKIWWKRIELAFPRRNWPEPKTPEDFAEVAKVKRGRPHLIRPIRCKDVLIEGVSLQNSAEWNVHPMLCDRVRVEGISILADPSSHNTDGINPEACSNVHILNCRINTGDDCVTLKSGLDELGRRMGRPTENVMIANCVMYRGHGGVTIGSEMSGGVRNVTVTNCVFTGTDNGIRIKSQRGRGGVVEGVVASNIVMQDVPTPFIITTFYSGSDKPDEVHPVNEGTPRYRNFLFSNITARGAKNAGAITGLREQPVEDITFSNVHIDAQTGFTVTNASDITFLDSVINTEKGPALLLRDSVRVEATRLSTRQPHADTPLIKTLSPATKS